MNQQNDTNKQSAKNVLGSNICIEKSPMEYYFQRNFESLAKCDLLQSINKNGDTVIHVMAKNLDKAAFELLMENGANIKEVINVPNNNEITPLHYAMDSIDQYPQKWANDFITYMIKNLGANPEIPDDKGRVISSATGTQSKSIYDTLGSQNHPSSKDIIGSQNPPPTSSKDIITGNLASLTNLVKKKSIIPPSTKEDIDFVKEITALYAPAKNSVGGNNGSKTNNDIRKMTETGKNDSFIINERDKNKWIDEYNREKFDAVETGHERFDYSNMNDPRVKKENQYMRYQNTLENTEDRVKKDWNLNSEEMNNWKSEKNMNQRLFNNNTNPLQGGRNKRTNKTANRGSKSFFDNWKTDDFDLNTTNNSEQDDYDRKYFQKRVGKNKSSFNDEWATNDFTDNDEESTDSNKFNFRGSNIFDSDEIDDNQFEDSLSSDKDYSGILAAQDRPRERNKEVDEIYRSFVVKIMDLLGVDEETAKFYRAAIKINIERNNPELQKRINDAIKIKEMEEIFKNKEKLNATLKKIDMDQIKEIMEERRKRREQFLEERQKNRESKPNKKKGRKDRTILKSENSSKERKSTESSEKIDSTENKPKKARRTTKKSSVAENGYVQSDDVEFSSEY